MFGIHRRTLAPEIIEKLLHGLHVVGFCDTGGIVSFQVGANRVEIADILAQRVNLRDVVYKSIGDVDTGQILQIVVHTRVALLEKTTVRANHGIAAVAHLNNKVIVARRQILDIDGVEQDVNLLHIKTLVERIVLHPARRLHRFNIIVDEKLALIIEFVTIIQLDIEIQFLVRSAKEGINPRKEIEAALGASGLFLGL